MQTFESAKLMLPEKSRLWCLTVATLLFGSFFGLLEGEAQSQLMPERERGGILYPAANTGGGDERPGDLAPYFSCDDHYLTLLAFCAPPLIPGSFACSTALAGAFAVCPRERLCASNANISSNQNLEYLWQRACSTQALAAQNPEFCLALTSAIILWCRTSDPQAIPTPVETERQQPLIGSEQGQPLERDQPFEGDQQLERDQQFSE